MPESKFKLGLADLETMLLLQPIMSTKTARNLTASIPSSGHNYIAFTKSKPADGKKLYTYIIYTHNINTHVCMHTFMHTLPVLLSSQ